MQGKWQQTAAKVKKSFLIGNSHKKSSDGGLLKANSQR
jgi:hypothetical protein